jgi:peptide/nickel transport system substrate-binding protein
MGQRRDEGYWQQPAPARLARRSLLGSAALGGVALAVACGSRTGGGQASPQRQAGSNGQPKSGGHLRHILPYSSGNIDPHTTEDTIGYGFIQDYWYETLVTFDFGNGTADWRIAARIIPWLAEKIEQPDPTTYVFSVRQGVKWHNGDPLTADDINFSFNRMISPNAGVNPNFQRYVGGVASAETVDDHTVRIKSKTADADFLSNLSQRNPVIVPAKVLQSGGSLSKQAIGTGPFRLATYTKDGSGEATRYENYWQKERPYLDGVKMTLKADDATMGAAFAAGQTDIITRTDRKQAEPLMQANPKARSRTFLEEQIQGLTFQEGKPPYNDPRVRQAIHLAIDRQEVDKAVTFGEGQISGPVVVVGKTGWHIPTDELLKLPGYRQPKDQDIAQAKQLLAAAGYASGLKTSIMFNQTYAVVPQDSEVVQAQLRRIGVDAELKGVDNATYVANRSKGDFDLNMAIEGSMYQPGFVVTTYYRSQSLFGKAAGMADAELDRLVDAQTVEFDATKRGQLFQQIERRILDQFHKAPLGTPTVYVLNQPWVYDWVDNRSSRQAVMNPSAIWVDVDQAKQAGQQL